MREAEGCAVAGFARRGMLRDGNIPPDRLAKFSLLDTGDDGTLRRIIEKPDPSLLDRLPEPVLISMNCWRFGPAILTACRAIDKSPRGEYEIPDAVMYSIEHLGQRYRVFPSDEAVLDLSSREDVERVTRQLANVEVDL
jgi:glucose-1-phosphate thymidylyltransferase